MSFYFDHTEKIDGDHDNLGVDVEYADQIRMRAIMMMWETVGC